MDTEAPQAITGPKGRDPLLRLRTVLLFGALLALPALVAAAPVVAVQGGATKAAATTCAPRFERTSVGRGTVR